MADTHKKLPYTYDAIKTAIGKANRLYEFETTKREQEDKKLDDKITAEAERAQEKENILDIKISEAALDTDALKIELETEKATREASDQTLQSNIDTEIAERRAADETLQTNISAVDKKVEDLEVEIDARSDVVDIVESKADLLNYQEKLTKNDIVKVLKDETKSDKTSYYKYPQAAKKGEVDPSKWEFIGAVDQYALTSELTAEANSREQSDNSLSQAISTEQTRAKNAESTLTASLANTEEKISDHIADINNPHSVTKDQVGLGSVANTEDSATPENNGTKKFTTGGAYTLKTSLENKIGEKYTKPSSGIPASDLEETYVVANSNITAGVGTKITYDAKGLITSSTYLSAEDIPELSASKITSGTFSDERIASASTWNSKQDAISDLATIRSNAESGKAAKEQIGTHTLKSDVPENAIFTDTTYTAGTNITIKNNVISATDTTYSDVTDSSHGLMTSSQKTKLDGIATGAEVNVQSDWSVTDTNSDAYIKNKPTLSISNGKITIGENSITPITSLDGYAKTSDLNSYATKDHTHEATLASSSETGTSLTAGSTYKLTAGGDSVIFKMPEASGIEAASDTVLGGIKTGYSESGKNYAIKISDQKAYVTVPWSDTTYSEATTSKSGLMSSSDKSKLDGIAENANKYELPIANSSTLGGVKSSTTGTQTDRDYAVEINSDGTMKVNVPWTDTTYTAGDNITISSNKISASDTHYESTLYVGTGSNKDATTTNDNTKITLVENNSIRASAQVTGEYPIQVSSAADKKITIDYTAPRIFMYYVTSSSTSGYANNAILTNYTSGSHVLGSSPSYLYLKDKSDAAFSKPLSEFRLNDILIPYYATASAIWRVSYISGSGTSTTLTVVPFQRPDTWKWTGGTFSTQMTGYTDSSLKQVTSVSGGTYGTFLTFHGWENSQMGYIKIMKTNTSSLIDNEDEYCANMATGENGYWGAQMLSISAMVPAGETYYLYAKNMSWVAYSYIPLQKS